MKTFSFGAIFSITSGLLSADMGEVHELLDYMTGDQLFTHQLPRAVGECEDELRAQFPRIAAIKVEEGLSPEAHMAFVEQMAHELGSSFEVAPLRPGQHERINPLTELAALMPNGQTTVVVVGDEEPDRTLTSVERDLLAQAYEDGRTPYVAPEGGEYDTAVEERDGEAEDGFPRECSYRYVQELGYLAVDPMCADCRQMATTAYRVEAGIGGAE